MSDNQWEDLIPFYVAGTLPEAEKRAFEQILASDEAYQIQLEEWITVAEGVRQKVAQWSTPLPPLRHVQPVLRMPSPSPAPLSLPRRRVPVTLVASILFIFVFVLFVLVSQVNKEEDKPLASATETPQACMVSNQAEDVVYIHEMPDVDFAVSGAIYPGDELPVSGRNELGWFRVDAPGGGVIGWIDSQLIAPIGYCDDIPIISR